jgi:hypothetical protein
LLRLVDGRRELLDVAGRVIKGRRSPKLEVNLMRSGGSWAASVVYGRGRILTLR